MNVLQNLIELYNSLPLDSTYRIVIKGILENLDKMQNVTIYDVAEMTNSSRTTVWRAIQKMGYENFTEFRHALQSAVKDYTYYNRMIPRKHCKDSESILKKTKDSMREVSRLLDEICTEEFLNDLTGEIHEAERIHFFLPFQLPQIASFQQNLAMSGKDTAYFSLLPDLLEDAKTLDEKSIVILSTIEHAETLSIRPVMEELGKRKATIWLLGDSGSRYSDYAGRILTDESLSPAGSMFLYQALFLALSEHYRAQYID